MTEEELEEMLERVPRSHPRFVEGVLSDAEEFGTADGIACFIRESPGLGAGYVAEHSANVFCQALLSRSRHGFVSHFPSPDDGRPTGSVTTN